MSYSARDIAEAFDCVGYGNFTQKVQVTQIAVFAHLVGNCECQLRRCSICGERETNKVPHHKPDCPKGMK